MRKINLVRTNVTENMKILMTVWLLLLRRACRRRRRYCFQIFFSFSCMTNSVM